jgi:hypothetical protein
MKEIKTTIAGWLIPYPKPSPGLAGRDAYYFDTWTL